ncbi:MarR family transcriptional regulator [archaeon]|jgi:predicted transcriptional regulator|nr:MarR family transcriptional regulator [archaeon]MBT3451288.1 MarR family transcriptional regulator [archaeon]MBT6869451.1 MarR family transcriptional regulator [archaeon]MBT7192614.1 MarR family transcriptional regulator [archaeon]MBT7380690.1 MarR family transcriptional regulator [archaeon]
MLDFACKRFSLDEVIRCGLALTKSECKLLRFMLKNSVDWYTTEELSKQLDLNLSTIQRSVKNLHSKEVIERSQNNLESGGYVFLYKIKKKRELREMLIGIVKSWSERVEKELKKW